MSSDALDGKGEVPSSFGAVFFDQIVDLRDFDSDEQAPDVWRVSSGDERIDCALLSADGGATSAVTSLDFERNVRSIAAGWIPIEKGGLRHAVVACALGGIGPPCPAILHFYPARK